MVSAQAALTEARAGEALTRLDVQNAVAAAFLGIVAAQRAVTAAQADLDRRDVLLQSVHALVTISFDQAPTHPAPRPNGRRRRLG